MSSEKIPASQSAPTANASRGHAVISSDTIFEGKIQNARTVEVYGEIRGEVEADQLVVHENGRFFGSTHARTARVFGTAQGELIIKELCAIEATGEVRGDVRYGRLSLASGANLEAHMRNIPPELGGDFELVVVRGQSAAITTADISAFDPDDKAVDLVFSISNGSGGHVAYRHDPTSAIVTFTQAELESGSICFSSHLQSIGDARFDVVVTDASGANSGAPKTVRVKVRDGARK